MVGGSNNFKAKGVKALAWISFGFAIVGGAALASTVVGGFIRSALGIFPDWVAPLAAAGAAVAMGIDLFVDGEPNKIALYMAIALPSLAAAVPGKLGDTVSNLAGQALSSVNGGLTSWLGVTSSLAIAATCVVVSLLMARRVVTKTGR